MHKESKQAYAYILRRYLWCKTRMPS